MGVKGLKVKSEMTDIYTRCIQLVTVYWQRTDFSYMPYKQHNTNRWFGFIFLNRITFPTTFVFHFLKNVSVVKKNLFFKVIVGFMMDYWYDITAAVQK